MSTDAARRAPGQWVSFIRAVHPRQAFAFAIVVGALVALMARPVPEVLVSAGAVLVAQLIMGLVNDLHDVDADQRSGAANKPVAAGLVPTGNVTFAIAVLALLVIPLALQNGLVAGAFLLSTLVVGYVHNRWLHGTVLSWVGWSATFALLTYFITLGGWGQDADGSEPLTWFVVLCAVLGFLVHFMTSLPDLVVDNKAGVRHLPLRVALRTGAPRLFVICGILTLIVTGLLVYYALDTGIAS